ncbi:MAG: FAD:protein FMN transferase [Halioglobus sp.]
MQWLFFAVLLIVFLASACSSDQDLSRLSGSTMGTTWHVSYLAGDSSANEDTLQRDIEAILAGVNESMSTYKSDSEISAFNRALPGNWSPVSQEFYSVLSAALSLGELSRGAYDVTIGPLVNRWGFGPEVLKGELPADEEVKNLLAEVGQEKLELDTSAMAVRKHSELSLDFSSLAKGYAVDRVANWLTSQSIDNFLVEVGGEMRLAGHSQRGDLWRIAIEQPQQGERSIAQALSLTDAAIATSGDYRNFFERDGKRFSHSIDPRTGYPVEHDLVSVTVVHDSAMLADGWATALTVLGADDALALAQEQDLAVYFIRRKEDNYVSSYTEAFAPYLQSPEG